MTRGRSRELFRELSASSWLRQFSQHVQVEEPTGNSHKPTALVEFVCTRHCMSRAGWSVVFAFVLSPSFGVLPLHGTSLCGNRFWSVQRSSASAKVLLKKFYSTCHLVELWLVGGLSRQVFHLRYRFNSRGSNFPNGWPAINVWVMSEAEFVFSSGVWLCIPIPSACSDDLVVSLQVR